MVKKESMGVMKDVFASIVRGLIYILAHWVGRGIKNAIFPEDSILDEARILLTKERKNKGVISM